MHVRRLFLKQAQSTRDLRLSKVRDRTRKMLSLAFQVRVPFKKHNPFYPLGHRANQNRNIQQKFKNPIMFSSLGSNRSAAGIAEETRELPHGLVEERLPKHVGVIMDGNRRWALQRGLPSYLGYECLPLKTKMMASLCADLGIKVCSLYCFAWRNWSRSKVEIEFLFKKFEEILQADLEDYLRTGVRINIIGEKYMLPKSLQNLIASAEETTKHNTRVQLLLAMSYGGRKDITHAFKSMAMKIQDGVLSPTDIDETTISKELQTSCCGEFADPDLIIRPGGEQRISDFLLWQSNFAELLFLEKKLPDFEEADFVEALLAFQGRHRRYGGHAY